MALKADVIKGKDVESSFTFANYDMLISDANPYTAVFEYFSK